MPNNSLSLLKGLRDLARKSKIVMPDSLLEGKDHFTNPFEKFTVSRYCKVTLRTNSCTITFTLS